MEIVAIIARQRLAVWAISVDQRGLAVPHPVCYVAAKGYGTKRTDGSILNDETVLTSKTL